MRPIILLPAVLALLAGCSGGTGTEAGSVPSAKVSVSNPAPDYPACDEVWVPGERLPDGYDGCYDADRDVVEYASAFACADGTALTSFKSRWWALDDGQIAEATSGEVASDPGYASAYQACSP